MWWKTSTPRSLRKRPKMAPAYSEDARKYCRGAGTEVDQINIKATTEEGLGFTGSGEGISRQSVLWKK